MQRLALHLISRAARRRPGAARDPIDLGRGLHASAFHAFHHLLDDGTANATANLAHGTTDAALRAADPALRLAHDSALATYCPLGDSPDAALGNAFLPANASNRPAHCSLRLPLCPSLAGHPRPPCGVRPSAARVSRARRG